jgi:hypothetical protein
MIKNIFSADLFPMSKRNPKVLDPKKERERDEYFYDWNSLGFRSIEFSEKPEIIVAGCSMTLGSSLPADAMWSSILQKKISEVSDYKVGNLSYHGGSIMKIVSALFTLFKKYEYAPKYIVCNFPPLDRFRFIDETNSHLKDYYANTMPIKKTKVSAPFKYEQFLPFEWVHYINLEYIKMLDIYCKSNGINLIMSSWSQTDMKNRDSIFFDNFDTYIYDKTRDVFPATFESVRPTKNIDEVRSQYVKIGEPCHEEYAHLPYFDYAFDYHSSPIFSGFIDPHPGLHRNIHWAEMYYEEIIKTLF